MGSRVYQIKKDIINLPSTYETRESPIAEVVNKVVDARPEVIVEAVGNALVPKTVADVGEIFIWLLFVTFVIAVIFVLKFDCLDRPRSKIHKFY